MADSMAVVTCSAPVNIAVIKYWGKRNEKLILPTNSSISVTLNQEQLSTTTSICRCPSFTEDRIWLNGREESVEDNPRLVRCISKVRRLCAEQHPSNAQDYEGSLHICSENNFPTAAGLASSAAGYACLVYSLSKLYDIHGDISSIARQGSGSACRSVYGGFVKWEKGTKEDGCDSIAVQLAPACHWPEMEVLVLVVSGEKKSVSSTAGMQTTVRTSSLMKERTEVVVPRRMQEMERAIAEKDFESFGRITMQDSNQFHAVCLDTYPPILYLNDISKKVIQIVSKYNEVQGKIKVAYTFDAGPNAVLYALSPDVPQILNLICHYFPAAGNGTDGYIRGLSNAQDQSPVSKDLLQSMGMENLETKGVGLQYIIHTKVGSGPTLLGDDKHLLNFQGYPISLDPCDS